MNNRLEEIIRMVKEDPNDPFLLYALALEYHKIENDKKTEEIYNQLLKKFPEYLPTYYQAAHFFWRKGQVEKARSVFLRGIELAKQIPDNKTLIELSNSYQNFLIEMEEL
jgi:tetratricopeptide (TPR) repeat protein